MDIMTIPQEAVTPNVEVPEECQVAGEQTQLTSTIFGTDPQAQVQGSVLRQVPLEITNANADTTFKTIPCSEENANRDDSESLISFSEAEDTITGPLDEQTHHAQIPLGQPLNNNTLATSEESAYDELCRQQGENVTPNDIVGVNPMGEFVAPEIKFFKDAITEDDLAIQNEQPRLSLDNTVIFSLPTEQGLITSPPKRQISINEENNVNIFLTFLTHM